MTFNVSSHVQAINTLNYEFEDEEKLFTTNLGLF